MSLCLALVTKLITHLSDLGAIMQSTFLELSDISTSMLTLSDYLILTTPNFSENSEPWNIKLTETLPYLRETSNLTPDLRPSYRVSPGQFNSFIFILRKNKCPNKLFKILDVTSRSLFGIEKEVNLHNNLATNAIIMSEVRVLNSVQLLKNIHHWRGNTRISTGNFKRKSAPRCFITSYYGFWKDFVLEVSTLE